ncbi:MAG: hypothetical protein DRJ43_03405, partial [Thermoprotei archaeon]
MLRLYQEFFQELGDRLRSERLANVRRRRWLQLYGLDLSDGYRFRYLPQLAGILRVNVDQYLE